MLKLLREAHKMLAIQKKAFTEFSATFTADVVKRWEETVRAWEEDPSKEDPFEDPRESEHLTRLPSTTDTLTIMQLATTASAVQRQLAEEEAAELANGILPPHETNQSVFLQVGLELEEQQ